jgi:ribosomal protein S18 acetylase RimI-like enzyme
MDEHSDFVPASGRHHGGICERRNNLHRLGFFLVLLSSHGNERGTQDVSQLTVDRAKPSDAVAVEGLLDAAAAWQQSRGIRQWTPGWFGDEVRETIASGDLYVARRGEVTVGCFLLEPGCPEWMAPWLIERGREPRQGAHLGRLTVARGATGRGLGVSLLNVASTLAAQRGLAYLRLDCPAENARLRRYYLDAGFSYLGDVETPAPPGERWISSVFERTTGPEPKRSNGRVASAS